MQGKSKRKHGTRGLREAISQASDPQIMRILAVVDSIAQRGSADLLIQPMRPRLARLRPPHPLRFERLLFQPLDLLIVPAARWRPGRQALPRAALMPMAEHIRRRMGTRVAALEAEIVGHTMADTDLISRLGRSLWPEAAAILTEDAVPERWDQAELGIAHYRPLADTIAALLAEAATLDRLQSDAAADGVPPRAEPIKTMLARVAGRNEPALPMLIALLLDRLPEAVELLPAARLGAGADPLGAAVDDAADLLLRQLDCEDGTDARIAMGSLVDAGAAVGRITSLLRYLNVGHPGPERRERLQAVRRRLDEDCRARFAAGLQEELLAPLARDDGPQVDIASLESAARGLRMLETEARAAGGGPTYDLLLGKAAETVRSDTLRDRLSPVDQLRLVEILVGSDAALALLDQPP